jgi:hypothetical protein
MSRINKENVGRFTNKRNKLNKSKGERINSHFPEINSQHWIGSKKIQNIKYSSPTAIK